MPPLFTNNLRESLKQSFFLSQEATVSDELIGLYQHGIETNDLSLFAQQTATKHNDQFNIYISHDIDWLNPKHPYSFINVLRSALFKHSWLSLKQVFQSDIFIRNIEQLLTLESELGVKAIYCLGATSGTQLGRYDIRYGINTKTTKKVIDLILSEHHTIGLQSSYHAHRQNTIPRQKAKLESKTGQKIVFHRSHYLHAPPSVLFRQLETTGVQYDLGYGRARKVGLRNGFPGKFKPIDPQTGEVINITVIPLILMDNVFFHNPLHKVMSDFKRSLQRVKDYNGSACISFHPENMIMKPQLYNYFEEIIHICRQEGATISPLLP